ncbi:hypothetical protein B0H14DRAFT_3481637 [Mycena olivaceomarginata]|nr:hypothetical protein B0H14DRAFT_3481637 [Mycena olivaceomarginata]
MTSRMNARRNFVHTIHDPSKSINLYISAIKDAVTCLNHLGVKPTNSEITDTLLMNLDESLSSTCTTILTSKKELTLTTLCPLKVIKNEDDNNSNTLLPALAHATCTSG